MLSSRPSRLPLPRRRSPFRRRVLLTVEQLEDRVTPATVSWDGGAGSLNWNDAANWGGNVLPGAGDDVTIDVPGDIAVVFNSGTAIIRSLTCAENLTVTGGTLSIDAASSVAGTLTLSGGSLTGVGELTVSGSLSWSNGASVRGGGSLILAVGASGTIDATDFSSSRQLGRTLDNRGTLTITGGGRLTLGSSATEPGTLLNRAGAVLTLAQDTDLQLLGISGLTAVVNNEGILRKQGAGESAFFSVRLDNSGTVELPEGTLKLTGGGTDVGAFQVGDGATLDFGGGTHHLQAAATLSSTGAVKVSAGTVIFEGTLTATTLQVSGGTAVLNSTTSLPALTLSSGILTGNGELTVTGSLSWGGGAGLRGGGTTILAVGASGTINATDFSSSRQLGRTLDNRGTLTITGGGRLTLGSSATEPGTLLNRVGAVLTLAQDTELLLLGISGLTAVVTNEGTLRKQGTGESALSNVRLDNSGTVELPEGTLKLTGGGTDAGPFQVGPGATLDFGGGTHHLQAAATVSGGGAVKVTNTSTVIFEGMLTAPTLQVSSGTVIVNGPFTTANLEVSGGTLALNSAISLPNLTLTGGATLTGSGELTVTGSLSWSNGASLRGGGGALVLAAGAAGTIDTTAQVTGYLLGRTLDNRGTLTLTGSNALLLGPASGEPGVLLNRGGATLTLAGGTDVGSFGASAQDALINQGTLRKQGNAESLISRARLDNTRVVEVQQGTLKLAGGGTSAGTFQVSAGATLDFNGGSHSLQAAASVSGLGSLRVSGGTATLDGTLSACLQVSGGTLILNSAVSLPALTLTGGATLTGAGELTVTGTLSWSNGARLRGGGTLILATGATGTIDTTAQVSGYFLGRMLDNRGTLTLTGSNALLLGPASGEPGVLLNRAGAILTLGQGTDVQSFGASGADAVVNQGTLRKQGATESQITGARLENTSDLELLEGTLRVTGAGSTVAFNGEARLGTAAGTSFIIPTPITGTTTSAGLFAPDGLVSVENSGTAGSRAALEVMSANLGAAAAGFTGNFSYGTLRLQNSHLRLVNNADNAFGSGAEALYVDTLIIPTGSSLDLNGLPLYVRVASVQGSVTGGTINVLADGGSLAWNGSTSGNIGAAGAVDEWTFFGRAGQAVSLIGDPGRAGATVPLAPFLGQVDVRLLGPDGGTLAQGVSAAAGANVQLLGVELPADGVYRVQVRGLGTATGNYQLALWDATTTTRPLALNQQVTGTLETAYRVDRWAFTAGASTVVRFDWVNSTASQIRFKLTGPGAFVGFVDLASDSSPLSLPLAGAYTLEASSGNTVAGSYAFRLSEDVATLLPLNTPYHGAFTGSGEELLFKVELPQEGPLQVRLDANGTSSTEVYLRRGELPTRRDHDASFTDTGPNHVVTVAAPVPGTWYVLVYANDVAAGASFTLQAVSRPTLLTAVTPARYAANDTVTLTLSGGGFVQGMQAELVAGEAVIPAGAVSIDATDRLTARFDLTGVAPGTYDVRVTAPGGTAATLAGGFEVLPAGEGKLQTLLFLPGALGRHASATLYLEYANIGTAALPAPILSVVSADDDGSDRPLLSLDESKVVEGFWSPYVPEGFGESVQIYADGATPGLLQPGERVRVPIYYIGLLNTPEHPWRFTDQQVELAVRVRDADDGNAIDWQSWKVSSRPDWISAEAWGAVFDNLAAGAGDTWGDYIEMLSDNAAYLGRFSEPVHDVDTLFGFEFQQALGLSPVEYVAAAVDAAMPTPGLPLQFQRTFGNTIAERYRMGPFGRGWSAPGQPTLTVDAQGVAVLATSAGSQLRFLPDGRREGAFFSPDGFGGTLQRVGEDFVLTDPEETVSRFRAGLLDSITDVNGNRLTYGYTAGKLTSMTHSSGASLTFTYNEAGLIASVTDSAGRTTTYGYDATNTYLLTATGPGGTTTYTYSMGNGAAREHALTSETGPDGTTRAFEYDAAGRLSATAAGGTQRVTFAYDGGRVTATDAAGRVGRLYFDHRGLVVHVEDGLGRYVNYEYGPDRRLSRETDSLGRARSYTWCTCGQIKTLTDELGQTVRFTLGGPLNRPTGFIDAAFNATQYAYDERGNLLSTTYADGTAERVAYDAAGNATSLVNRRGQEVERGYNAAGQVTREQFADGTAVDYAYDARGRLASATTAEGGTTFEYDSADRLTKVTYPTGRFLEYAYDAADRRTRMADQDGFAVNYGYDAAGRLHELHDRDGVLIVRYTYGTSGLLVKEEKGNGTATEYTYDAAGQVDVITHRAPNGDVSGFFDYSHDTTGRRTGLVTHDGTWAFTYDRTGQLIRAVFTSTNAAIPSQDLSYEYDPAGNRVRSVVNGTASSFVVNNMNQITAGGGTSYLYDADGNLIEQTGPQGKRYTYDVRGRLVKVEGPEGTFEYEYDAFGNRTAVVANGVRTEYLIDPFGLGNVVAAFATDGARTASYVHGLGLESMSGVNGWAYYDFDALGSTTAITGAGGGLVNSYAYEPFGGALRSVEGVENPFEFVGQAGVMNDDSGLYFMRARFYDPLTGRFTAQDPLRLAGGDPNLYRYGRNHPTGFVDPSGLDTIDIGISGGAAFGLTFGVRLGTNDETCVYFGLGGTTPGVAGAITFSEGNPTSGDELYLVGAAGDGVSGIVVGTSFLPDGSTSTGIGIGIGVGAEATGVAGFYISSVCFDRPEITGPPPGGNNDTLGTTGTAESLDPNDKLGAAGYGPQAHIRADAVIPYRVNFENLGPGSVPTPARPATAPAQRVEITDRLSPNLDWRTLRFTEAGFGDHRVTVPAGRQHFFTTVVTTYNGRRFNVEVELDFDPVTGLVRVVFQSIDPNTALPPDVLTGFLPPEDGTGVGKGYFGYTVQPRANLPSGTQIRNIARISFDGQTVITTNQVDPHDPSQGTDLNREALNTLDAELPTSSVEPLPAEGEATTFTVRWHGQDDAGGAGVATYDVFVSADGGPFVPWLQDTTALSAQFTGTLEHNYAFYSVAIDGVGHRQPTPATAQATILLAPRLTLDVDGDGEVQPLTDGLLILRYLFGFTGESLTSDALNPSGIRNSPLSVSAFLQRGLSTLLDVDGNGAAEALTDGLLILRYLFGFTGSSLVQDAVEGGATRTTPEAITTHLLTFWPGQPVQATASVGDDSFTLLGMEAPASTESQRQSILAAQTSWIEPAVFPAERFQVADLDGHLLGLAAGDLALLDRDTGAAGWFVDPTPLAHAKFLLTENRQSWTWEDSVAKRMALFAELGHVLGLENLTTEPEWLLAAWVERRARRLPSSVEVDRVFELELRG